MIVAVQAKCPSRTTALVDLDVVRMPEVTHGDILLLLLGTIK
jgi:hypothetical protein